MPSKNNTFILFLGVFLLLFLLLHILDMLNLVSFYDKFSFLIKQEPTVIESNEYPTEIDKISLENLKNKLLEKEEELANKEQELKQKSDNLSSKESQVEGLYNNLLVEKKRLNQLTEDLQSRNKKVAELANKVKNMPPDKAVEMMKNWQHFDIIDVLREVDKQSDLEGTNSITPYLLTLFEPTERSIITRKMLLTDPIETQDSVSPDVEEDFTPKLPPANTD